jgi:site-specific DNA-methyltransferase (adenine-specific)
VTPYYEHAGITIYHGDCREIAPRLGSFDLLLTDPPYGIGEAAGKNKSRGRLAISRDYGNESWDDSVPAAWVLQMLRERSSYQIIFGGNYFALLPSSCWLVWDKVNGETDFADCELAWTNFAKAVRKIEWMWHGMLRQNNEARFHPTQKPLGVMKWALSQAPTECQTVLDPFMGSGTTLVAAKQAGLSATGIEQSERYCEIAAKRLGQEVFSFEEAV